MLQNVHSRGKEAILTVRVAVSRRPRCTGPGTGVCGGEESSLGMNMKHSQPETFSSHLPRGDGGHGGVLVAVPHPVVVRDLPGCGEGGAVISQQPLIIWMERRNKDRGAWGQPNCIHVHFLYKLNHA